MELIEEEDSMLIPSNTESVWCAQPFNPNFFQNKNKSESEREINGFGLPIYKRIYKTKIKVNLKNLSSFWLLLTPSEGLKKSRNEEQCDRVPLNNCNVSLAFGSFISPNEFKCTAPEFLFNTKPSSKWNIYFGRFNSFICVNMDQSRYELRKDHVNMKRGIIIDIKSRNNFIIYICLQGNLKEYVYHHSEIGYIRQFSRQSICDGQLQPRFSAMRLSIDTQQTNSYSNYKIIHYFIQFFSYHCISIYFGSIQYLYQSFSGSHNLTISEYPFIYQYAWHMLNSVECQIYNQLNDNEKFKKSIVKLFNEDNDGELIYYIFERLRRFVLEPENISFSLKYQLPTIQNSYYDFYLQSSIYKMDKAWINYVRIPWFRLTPTCLIVKPFKFMRSNRVFRYLRNVSQSMALVEFRDNTESECLSKELLPFIEYYLQNGFMFGNRHYIYLHHAQSQVRQKQFYFYCEDEGKMNRETLESWMGNFDDERLPAKNTARRTQPFSSTEETIEIDRELVDIIPDVKTIDGKYNFTDGVGQISSDLNFKIHESMGINIEQGEYVSSVLQIRYGGCKGTIAVNPQLDGKAKQLLIRKSMDKFECNHQMLELCKRSLRRNLCLNREVINLLSYRGISNECILVFQLRNIIWLITSLVSNQHALDVLRNKVLNVLRWSQISHHPNLLNEPFFRCILLKTIKNNLHQIMTRAHIRVSQGRYMFGIVDEYKVLREGQVFIQITDENGNKTILEGPVAITKNPCHHPGDLRVLKAVNKKSLHHLYDVLVFPQQGSRPHASEISGSDLDGDEYTVIWDPQLVPTSPNPTPYDYDSGPSPQPLNRIVTRNDRLKVILDICEQDNLGRLSNIHLILTDKLGIDSKEAISLAAGISQELDSVKSGQHPYTSDQIKDLIAIVGRTRPDFMQTCGYEVYESPEILGKLFRSARCLYNSFTNAFSDETDELKPDENLLHQGYEKYIDFAQKLYERYQFEMLEMIGSYGFSNEVDLFCCNESCNMKANERSDVQQTVQKFLKAIFNDIRKMFYNDLIPYGEVKAKSAACYYVAYTDKNDKNKRMLSFPWLFASSLLGNNNLMEKQQSRDTTNLLPNNETFPLKEILEICLENACSDNDEQMINCVEKLIQSLIEYAKDPNCSS